MLGITVPDQQPQDYWDEANESFVQMPAVKGEDLQLEHSLVSLSKWEEITEKPFLGKDPKTREETLLYIKCMTISPVNDPDVFDRLSSANYKEISDYIDRKMTATWFNEQASRGGGSGEVITAELVYYWMVALKVPPAYQYWHFNKLLTLIKVLNFKNQPTKKMPRQDMAAQRAALNEKRLAQMNTTG